MQMNGWFEYFMKMAEYVSTRSKDRSTKVGAVIVEPESKSILSTGYNGFPRNMDDNIEARHLRPAKLLYTEHAERNAIYAAARNGVRVCGACIFITGGGIPCADCSRAIIQAGICQVVVMDRKFDGKSSLWVESCAAGKEMLIEVGITIVFLNSDYTVSKLEENRDCCRY